MTAAEGSVLGIAKQSAEGTPNTTDNAFKYLLYREGSVAPNNVIIPLDAEVGGGALLRNVVKVAVNSGGGISVIPRPETLGMFLMGATGHCVSAANYRDNCLMAAHALDGSTVVMGPALQPTAAVNLCFTASGACTDNVTISGTVDGSADTEVLALTGTTRAVSTKKFSALTSIALPTAGGVTVNAGIADGSYTHMFTLDSGDMFSAPFYTVRSQLAPAKANAFAEQFQDVLINMLALEWKAPGFVGGTVAMVGGKPTPVTIDYGTEETPLPGWEPLKYLDSGPQFLTSVGSKISLNGSDLSVLGGSFAAGSAVPLDEQFIVGSYHPEKLAIVNRSFGINLIVKISDEILYKQMMYNPNGTNTWAAEIMREARMNLEFKSDQDAAIKLTGDTTDQRPYAVKIEGNNMGGDNANVAWAMAPVATRAQRQVVAQLTGTFMASPDGTSAPITVSLVNRRASY